MTDAELLELAAKAAGMDVRPFTNGLLCFWHQRGPAGAVTWNPLADDGDALRLAVKLRLDVQFETGSVSITNVIVHDEDGFEADCAYMLADDATGATRRAIVRAAAALAKPSPSQDTP